MTAKEELAKENAGEPAAALVDGTTDENFLKAPVKVIMPEESKAKAAGQSAGAVGSIIFALLFNILLFLAAPLLLTNLGFIWAGWADAPAIAAGAGWFATIKSLRLGDQAALVDRVQPDRRHGPDVLLCGDDLYDVVFEGHPPGFRISRCRAQDGLYLGKRPRPDARQRNTTATSASAMRHVVPDGGDAGRDRAVFGDQI